MHKLCNLLNLCMSALLSEYYNTTIIYTLSILWSIYTIYYILYTIYYIYSILYIIYL